MFEYYSERWRHVTMWLPTNMWITRLPTDIFEETRVGSKSALLIAFF